MEPEGQSPSTPRDGTSGGRAPQHPYGGAPGTCTGRGDHASRWAGSPNWAKRSGRRNDVMSAIRLSASVSTVTASAAKFCVLSFHRYSPTAGCALALTGRSRQRLSAASATARKKLATASWPRYHVGLGGI